jgi:hypothetical protein
MSLFMLLRILYRVQALIVVVAISSTINGRCSADDSSSATLAANAVAWQELKSLELLPNPIAASGTIELRGKDSAFQLIVLGHFQNGSQVDLTRSVTYHSTSESIAQISQNGYIEAVGDGDCKIEILTPATVKAEVTISVKSFASDVPIHFGNQITPIFTKYGCNSGGCHGKSGGQNGFRLSLLGFEPADDYQWLVHEGRGRRLFPASPDHSLLLQKAIGKMPHGGGAKMTENSPPYRILRRWIEQGMPKGSTTDAVVQSIEIFPKQARIQKSESQQLSVLAHYSDGSSTDITRMTTFESNDPEMAELTPEGLATFGKIPGTVAVMARFQGQVAVFRATIPLGAPVASLPPTVNLIDKHVFAQLQSLGLPPSNLTDDATFLRRVTVDIAGRLPRIEETELFLGDTSADKRQKYINQLLESNDYAANFATKWAAILRNKRSTPDDRWRTYSFHQWLYQRIASNVGMNQVVSELLTASGTPDDNPAVGWYRELTEPEALVEDTAQLFMGQRIGCAKCHHHPQEKWSQADYYGLAAFFTRIGRKGDVRASVTRVVHQIGDAASRHPRTGEALKPRGLGAEVAQVDPWQDPREVLAHWLTAPENPFFARAVVNRYWKHFFGRGLVEPEDDMRLTNPASHPELLDELAADFVAHGYDVKYLISLLCNSSAYQLSAIPNEYNADDKSSFSRYYPKRLAAEVTLDAVDQITGQATSFPGLPAGTLANSLPDNGFPSYFLTVFGRPEGNSACECERSSEANLAQCLHLINSDEVQKKLRADTGLVAQLGQSKDDISTAIRSLYMRAYSRPPEASEQEIALRYLQSKPDLRAAFEDLAWTLMNTKEFLFNH